jgi:TP901 family phage tail tape measure protein
LANNNEAQITVSVFNQDFNKSMKEMGREAGKLNQEFKLQQEQMKLTATDAEKLAAKMDFLNNKHEIAKRKVEEAERQYEAIKAQFGENSQAAQDMARRLTSVRIEEQQLANQISETNSALIEQNNALNNTSEALLNAGEKMKGAGETLTTGVTAPLLALGAGALLAASNVEEASSKIQAQLGITAEEAKILAEEAKDLWLNGFGASIDEAANAIIQVKNNMVGLNSDELKQAAANAFILADTFGIEIAESTSLADNLMAQFSLNSEQAFDAITTGFQNGLDYGADFADTLREYGPIFAGMGMDINDTLSFMESAQAAGFRNLDVAADTFKEFSLIAQEGGEDFVAALSAMGKETETLYAGFKEGKVSGEDLFYGIAGALDNIKDPQERFNAGVATMGTMFEDNTENSVKNMAYMRDELETVEGATEEAGKAISDTFGNRLQVVFRELQDAMQPLGDILLDMAEQVLPKLSSMVEKVANWFSALSPIGQNLVVIIGIIAAAIGPLLMVIGTLATGIGTVVGWFAPLAVAIAEAGGLIAWLGPIFTAITGPIGITIAAVVGLIAIFVALYKNNEDFRNNILVIWESIKNGFQVALDFIWNIVQSVMTSVMSFFGSVLNDIKAFWDENGAQIMSIVQTYFGLVWAYLQMIMGTIKGLFQVVWPIITGVIKVAWATIQSIISTAINIVLGVIQVALKLLKGDWSGAWETIKSTAKTIMDNIVGYFKGIDLKQIGKDIIQGLINGIGSMAESVKTMVSKLAEKIPQWAKEVLGIHSPSKVMMEVGEFTGEGAIVGLKKKIAQAKKMAAEFAQSFVPNMSVNGQLAMAASSVDVSFGKGQIEAIQNAFSSSINKMPQIQGDVYIDGRTAGQVLAPYVQTENEFKAGRF